MQIGITGLLTLLFIALKLTGVIAWSWLWVLAPLWIGVALVVLVVGTGVLVALVKALKAEKRYADKRRSLR